MHADGVGGEIADGNVTIGFLHQRIGEVDADPCTVDIGQTDCIDAMRLHRPADKVLPESPLA